MTGTTLRIRIHIIIANYTQEKFGPMHAVLGYSQSDSAGIPFSDAGYGHKMYETTHN